MSTSITYQYRDADNYKENYTVIVSGEPTPELIARIIDSLEEGEYFVPDEFEWSWGIQNHDIDEEVDHPYCELMEEDIVETDEEPTVDMTIEQVTDEFERCAEIGWMNIDGYQRRMEEIYGFSY